MPKKINNILMICPTFYPIVGGSETYYLELIEYLRRQGHRVYVVTASLFSRDSKLIEKSENLLVIRFPCLTKGLLNFMGSHPLIYFTWLAPFLLVCSLGLLLFRRKIDVIHTNSMTAGFVGMVTAKVFRKRSVVSTHGSYFYEKRSRYRPYTKALRMVYSSYDQILAAGEKSRKELIELGVAESKINNYTHWVNQDVFKPLDKQKCKQECGWSDKFIVLFAGRLVEIKGVKALLSVASEVNERICFVFAGDGPLKSEVKQAAETSQNIIYSGIIDYLELPVYYNAADLVIVPSQAGFESFNRVLIEALSCGTPVIAADRGEMSSTVSPSVGLLIEPSINEITQAVESLFHNKERLLELSDNCRPYAVKHFSINNPKVIEASYEGGHNGG